MIEVGLLGIEINAVFAAVQKELCSRATHFNTQSLSTIFNISDNEPAQNRNAPFGWCYVSLQHLEEWILACRDTT
jgi:hypothetical protein